MAVVLPVEIRFRAKYRVDEKTQCWLWFGATDKNGYGTFQNKGKSRQAHIVSWLMAGNTDGKEGEALDHLCRNRNCVNPAHLERVTVGENTKRGWDTRGRSLSQDQCKQGHWFTTENTSLQISPDGHISQRCRTCDRARSQAVRDKKKLGTVATEI